MVWTTPAQLQNARLLPPPAADSLFQKAAEAGIASNEKDPSFPGYLSNTDFLQTLVLANKLSQDAAAGLLATVAAGSRLDDDPIAHGAFWDGVQQALFYSSLPETYAYRDIAVRLARSGQLTSKSTAVNRLDDTGKLIAELVLGLADGSGTGLHRAFLLGARHQRLGKLDQEPLINQVSLAFTLLTFSYTPFLAMIRAGVDVPDAARRLAWLAMWNVVGALMGIEADGLPASLDEADALDILVRASPEFLRLAESQQLITVLVEIAGNRTGPFFLWAGEPLMTLLGVQRPPV